MKPNDLIQRDDADQIQSIYISEPAEKTSHASLIANILTAFAAIVIIVSVFVMTPHFANYFKQSEKQALNSIAKPEEQVPPAHLEAYLWTAKLKLEDLKLNHRLDIGLSDTRTLKIEGNISKQEVPSWNSFQNWYESKEGFPKLDHKVSTNAKTGDIPELKSVWFDATPTAYFADGRFGNIGTVLNDGWKIVSIEAWAVFVERNGTTITLSY